MKNAKRFLFALSLPVCIIACTGRTNNHDHGQPVIHNDSNFNAPDISVNPYATVDLSPMDISYYPAEYPKLKTENPAAAPPLARVIYSRPHLQGRSLFPGVLKYGSHWRLGANEATEIQFYTEADILGEKIKAGRYIIYCIPDSTSWTIALNSNIDSWGLVPDSTMDIAQFTIPSTTTRQRVEFFTMVFEKSTGYIDLLMAWDNVEARLPIKF